MPYRIINWEKYQARTERSSNPWVKFHRTTLLSADFFAIPKARRWEWPLLLLLANHATGIIEDSDEDIAFKLRYKDGDPWDCKPFIGSLLENVDTTGTPMATNGDQRDTTGCLEERRGEEKRSEEIESYSFDDGFWKLSPRTGVKKKAKYQWGKLSARERAAARYGIEEQTKIRSNWERVDSKHFVPAWPHMERWLRDKRWTEELEKPQPKLPKHMDERDHDIERQCRAKEADEAQTQRHQRSDNGSTPDGPEPLGAIEVPRQEE